MIILSGEKAELTQVRALCGLATLEMNCTNNAWPLCLSAYKDAIQEDIDPPVQGQSLDQWCVGWSAGRPLDCLNEWIVGEGMNGRLDNGWMDIWIDSWINMETDVWRAAVSDLSKHLYQSKNFICLPSFVHDFEQSVFKTPVRVHPFNTNKDILAFMKCLSCSRTHFFTEKKIMLFLGIWSKKLYICSSFYKRGQTLSNPLLYEPFSLSP